MPLVVLICLVLVCALAPARAAESATPAVPSLMELSFDELLDVRVDRVYGASRHEQTVAEAPASVSIVTAEDIKLYGYRSLADVLRSVRGLYVTYDRNYSYLGVRGFNRPGDYNSRVLLLVDGHRVNDNIFESAFLGPDALIDVDNIERLEFIRGPSSSIYGNNAFFGVINIITRHGAQIDGAEVSGEAGSFDTYKGRFTMGKLFTNGVEFSLSGSYYTSEGQDRLYYKEYDSPATQHGVVRHADGEEAVNLLGSLSYRDFTLSTAFSSRSKNIPTASFESAFGDPRAETVDERAYVDLKYEHAFEASTRLLVRAYYDAYRYYGTYPRDYVTNRIFNIDNAAGDWAGGEVQLTQKIFDRHTLVFGADYRENFRQEQISYDRIAPRHYDVNENRSSANAGAYAQLELAVRTNLILNAGLRYDYYTSFGSSVNPRFGLIYNPWTESTFKLLYGRAFRAPNTFELYYSPLTRSLEPETIDTYEIVYEQKLPARHRLTASAYYYAIDNLISSRDDPSRVDIYFANVDCAEARGVELELEGKYARGVQARASYAYQRAKDSDTGQELSNSPRQLGKLNLSVPLYADQVIGSLELQYYGDVGTLSGATADDFFLLNFTLFSRKIVKNLEASVSLYNLLNSHYSYPGTEDHAQDQILQDGRSVRAKLVWKF